MPQPFASLKFHLISDVSPLRPHRRQRQQQRLWRRHRRRSSCSSPWPAVSSSFHLSVSRLSYVIPRASKFLLTAPFHCLPLSVCHSHILRCRSSSPSDVSFSFYLLDSCISCVIPCVSQHLLSHSSTSPCDLVSLHSPYCVPFSHRSSCPFAVSCPFYHIMPAFPCAIPRVLQHLLCHFSFSPCCVPFHNIPRRRSSYPSTVLCSFHLLFLIPHSISLLASPRRVPLPYSIHSVSYA